MPYIKPGQMVEAQRKLSKLYSKYAIEPTAGVEEFMGLHPISGNEDDDSRFAKVDGVWVREDSIPDAGWIDPYTLEEDE